jgi:glucose-1-phosphate cytidylyltransferase
MKVILLAGGLGTRISEETIDKPKPMVKLGSMPILWHVMSIFAQQGYDDFLIATGYKGEVIESWVNQLQTKWRIETFDTGLHTQTGGRIAQCMRKVDGQQVIATYGDGLGNVNIGNLLDFHVHHGRLATVTAVRPPARFGVLRTQNGEVTQFGEKNQADAGWINGGFFVLNPGVEEMVLEDAEPFETGAIPRLVNQKSLMAYHHDGFWQPMDTLREKQELERMIQEGQSPWLSGL